MPRVNNIGLVKYTASQGLVELRVYFDDLAKNRYRSQDPAQGEAYRHAFEMVLATEDEILRREAVAAQGGNGNSDDK